MPSTPESQRSTLKAKYGWLYKALVKLLAEEDLMGLVKMGAPDDEYEPEVDTFLPRLPEANSPDELGQIIYEAFVKCFGKTFVPSDKPPSEQSNRQFETIGEKAWAFWTRWREEKQQK